jgi:ribosomal protein S27E
MRECPLCGSFKTVLNVRTRQALCIECGTLWSNPDGGKRTKIHRIDPRHPSIAGWVRAEATV